MTTREKYEARRDALGLTDYTVMKRANIAKATFYTWRAHGIIEPDMTMNVRNMRKVAEVLKVSLEDLIGDAT